MFLLLISGDDAFENKTVEFSVLAYKIEKNVHCNYMYHILQFEENIVICILNIPKVRTIVIFLYPYIILRNYVINLEKKVFMFL